MRQRKAPKGRPQWVTVTLNINKPTPLANTVCGNSKVNVREAEKTDYIRVGAKLSCYSAGTTQKEFCRSANPTKYSLIIHENNTEFDWTNDHISRVIGAMMEGITKQM